MKTHFAHAEKTLLTDYPLISFRSSFMHRNFEYDVVPPEEMTPSPFNSVKKNSSVGIILNFTHYF